MKLLIVTQKVNKDDQILGFFHSWIAEFAKQCQSVTVICLEEGVHQLPANVKVLSLGKESGVADRRHYFSRFFKYIVNNRADYDTVLVHMNPIYVVLGGIVWKILGKKIALWYTHKHVDLKLRVAAFLSDVIFTASKESFRLKNEKVRIVGHGIDTDVFKPVHVSEESVSTKKTSAKNKSTNTLQETPVILSVGRISSTKNQLVMIEALKKLREAKIPASLNIVGAPVTSPDRSYEHQLGEKTNLYQLNDKDSQNRVHFIGPIPPDRIVEQYQRASVFVNLSSTGSLDKAILEAMACEVPVLTSNEAFKGILPEKNTTTVDAQVIADKIKTLFISPRDVEARRYVVDNHDLKKLISKLVSMLEIKN